MTQSGMDKGKAIAISKSRGWIKQDGAHLEITSKGKKPRNNAKKTLHGKKQAMEIPPGRVHQPVQHSSGRRMLVITQVQYASTIRESGVGVISGFRFTEMRMAVNVHKSTVVKHRRQLGAYVASRGLLHGAAEVGVDRAVFSRMFLRGWPGSPFFAVDAWARYSGYQDVIATRRAREPDYAAAVNYLQPYADRVCVIRKMSLEAALMVPDGSLDFVYIDANHNRPHVDNDIAAWWPKVRPGGLISGHDYGGDWLKDVGGAVNDFCDKEGIEDLFLTAESRYASWFVHK